MEQPFIPCKIEQIKPQQIFSGLLKVTKYGLSIQPVADSKETPHQPFWLHSLLVSVDKKKIILTPSSSSNIGSSSNLQPQFQQHALGGQSLALFITYRNFTALRITFRGVNGDRDAMQVWSDIQKWMNATSLEDFHCFSPSVVRDLRDISLNGQQIDSDGEIILPIDRDSVTSLALAQSKWSAFEPYKDFERMGLGNLNQNWRISTINQDYEFCPTYPSLLGVPSKISDNTLRHIAKFRSKGRIPSLSYLHPNKFSITRSAQPLVGWKSDRSIQDEKLIEAIFKSHLATGQSEDSYKTKQHLIIDARPVANAIAQTALGAGTEPESHYPFCKIVFLGIENIHVVRDSFTRLYDACVTEDGGRVKKSSLDKSGWLKHIKTIIDGTLLIVQSIHIQNSHVLIHCSDGWDRTAQLSSLSQICLDPYYRTIDGLMVLLDKEWCSFGHKFKDRCGHLGKGSTNQDVSNGNHSVEKKLQQAGKNMLGAASKLLQSFATPNTSPFPATYQSSVNSSLTTSESITPNNVAPKEISPVFPQFLDCLYQIWKQYPTAFEYDERILEFLFLAAYSCSFGNFLFNNEKEAKSFRTRWSESSGGKPIDQASISVWRYISANKISFVNPFYTPTQNQEDRLVLMPSSANLAYWTRVYRLTKNNYAEEDAVLTSSNISQINNDPFTLSMESVNAQKSTLDNLYDPLVPMLGSVDIKERDDIQQPPPLMKKLDVDESEMIDLQSPIKLNTRRTVSQLGENTVPTPVKSLDGFVENPLMSNPWS